MGLGKTVCLNVTVQPVLFVKPHICVCGCGKISALNNEINRDWWRSIKGWIEKK